MRTRIRLGHVRHGGSGRGRSRAPSTTARDGRRRRRERLASGLHGARRGLGALPPRRPVQRPAGRLHGRALVLPLGRGVARLRALSERRGDLAEQLGQRLGAIAERRARFVEGRGELSVDAAIGALVARRAHELPRAALRIERHPSHVNEGRSSRMRSPTPARHGTATSAPATGRGVARSTSRAASSNSLPTSSASNPSTRTAS